MVVQKLFKEITYGLAKIEVPDNATEEEIEEALYDHACSDIEWDGKMDIEACENYTIIQPLTFRMQATVKMNRAVDKENDYISPGGYEFVMNGKNVQFDFEESQTMIDKEDPSIIHIMHKNPDYNSFEDLLSLLKNDLENVTEIPEFFVYTGEPGETDLMPVSLLDCSFVLPYADFEQIDVPKSVCEKAVLASNIDLQEEAELE